MVEFGERQRRPQFEAAGFLLLRDGDGGEEGGFGGGGLGGVLFEEDFAADAMDFGVEPALTRLRGFGDDRVDRRKRRLDLAAFRLSLGQPRADDGI